MTNGWTRMVMNVNNEYSAPEDGYMVWDFILPETLKENSLITLVFKDPNIIPTIGGNFLDYSVSFSSSTNYSWSDNAIFGFDYDKELKTIYAEIDTRNEYPVGSYSPEIQWYNNTITQIQTSSSEQQITEIILERELQEEEELVYVLSETPKRNSQIALNFECFGEQWGALLRGGFSFEDYDTYLGNTRIFYDGDKTIIVIQETGEGYGNYSVTYISEIGLYNIKDNTHIKNLTWDWYKDEYHAGWFNASNVKPHWNFIGDIDLTLGAIYNNNYTSGAIQFLGKDNNDNQQISSQLGLIAYNNDTVNNNSLATLLTTRKFDSSGNDISNYFNIFILADGTKHYRLTQPFNFRSDIIYSPNKIITFGDITKTIANNKPVSVPTSTNKTIIGKGPNVDPNDPNDVYITLTSGLWFVTGCLVFTSNTTGHRTIKLSDVLDDTANTISTKTIRTNTDSTGSRLSTSQFFYVAAGTTKKIYLIAWQNSGSSLNTAGMIQAVLV